MSAKRSAPPPDAAPAPAAAAPAVRPGGPLPKAPTGIEGFDELTGGGLPAGRTTLVCGGPGCGKTLFGMTFLVHGAVTFGEPGVVMTFEEDAEEIARNVASLGYDVPALVAEQKLAIDHVRLERAEIAETGEFDLEALFVRLGFAIDAVGARRVVLDTIEALFAHLSDEGILRAELRRLFRWLKDRGVTTVVTGERGTATLTRHGLEEYISDAVVVLDHRVVDQVSTRRLRIVKCRGSPHGTNEYPFLIDAGGITVVPLSALGLAHPAPAERVSSGIAELDAMLAGGGVYRGSTVLVSGTAGVGKSTMAAHFADAAARRGERCVYVLLEESPAQVVRNMRAVGLDLGAWVERGRLHFHAVRPTHFGLEMHLAALCRLVGRVDPGVAVVDPVSSLLGAGATPDVHATLMRLVDFLKSRGVTALMTSLTHGPVEQEHTDVAISSLVDTWIVITSMEAGGERRRALRILKSRGMGHSSRVRPLDITDHGIRLGDPLPAPATGA